MNYFDYASAQTEKAQNLPSQLSKKAMRPIAGHDPYANKPMMIDSTGKFKRLQSKPKEDISGWFKTLKP